MKTPDLALLLGAVLTMFVGCASPQRGATYGHEQELRRQLAESTPMKSYGYSEASGQKVIKLIVLAHLVANADQDASLVRFVGLSATDLERLRASCGSRYEIHPWDKADRTGGVLHLRGNGREGVYLEVGVAKIQGRNAEVSGAYVHLDSFASFTYKLHYDDEWKIVSCEFFGAS